MRYLIPIIILASTLATHATRIEQRMAEITGAGYNAPVSVRPLSNSLATATGDIMSGPTKVFPITSDGNLVISNLMAGYYEFRQANKVIASPVCSTNDSPLITNSVVELSGTNIARSSGLGIGAMPIGAATATNIAAYQAYLATNGLVVGGGSGTGDATLAGDNTWTGTNMFNGSVFANNMHVAATTGDFFLITNRTTDNEHFLDFIGEAGNSVASFAWDDNGSNGITSKFFYGSGAGLTNIPYTALDEAARTSITNAAAGGIVPAGILTNSHAAAVTFSNDVTVASNFVVQGSSTFGTLNVGTLNATNMSGNAAGLTNVFGSVVDAKRSFGAVGNGITDDTIALQAALYYISTNTTYNTLYIPKGEYKISSTLTFPSTSGAQQDVWGRSYRIIGAGMTETIINATNCTGVTAINAPNPGVSGLVLEEFELRGPNFAATGGHFGNLSLDETETAVGIKLDGTMFFTRLHRVMVSGFQQGVYLKDNYMVRLNECHLNANWHSDVFIDHTDTIEIVGCEMGFATNANQFACVAVTNSGAGTSRGITIKDCEAGDANWIYREYTNNSAQLNFEGGNYERIRQGLVQISGAVQRTIQTPNTMHANTNFVIASCSSLAQRGLTLVGVSSGVGRLAEVFAYPNYGFTQPTILGGSSGAPIIYRDGETVTYHQPYFHRGDPRREAVISPNEVSQYLVTPLTYNTTSPSPISSGVGLSIAGNVTGQIGWNVPYGVTQAVFTCYFHVAATTGHSWTNRILNYGYVVPSTKNAMADMSFHFDARPDAGLAAFTWTNNFGVGTAVNEVRMFINAATNTATRYMVGPIRAMYYYPQ